MQDLSPKVTVVSVAVCATIVLTLALLFPDSGPVALAGGIIRATILAGLTACFATRFPEPSLYLVLLLALMEPTGTLKLSELTPEQNDRLIYHSLAIFILIGGAAGQVIFQKYKP